MQKKIIALAVASLVSGAAFAQSNVSVYGFADVNYLVANDSNVAGTKTLSAVGAGGINGSRLGFKGEEDLGNGLSAKFNIAIAFQMDTGAQGRSSLGTSPLTRWSTVSLASKTWGEIEGGRRDSFQDQLLGSMSADARTMVSQVTPVYVDRGTNSNFIAYSTPVWSGFQVKAGFSTADNGDNIQDLVPTELTGAVGSENKAANLNNRVYALVALYDNGPLKLGASYERNKFENRNNSVAGMNSSYDAGNTWDIAGAYDFGVVRIDGAYGRINYAQNTQFSTAAETKDNRKQWTLGVSAPVGASGIASLVYAHAKVEYNSTKPTWNADSVSLWGLAYRHNLSKRTTAYAAYVKINQNDTSHSLVSPTGTPANSNAYQQGFQVGLKHAF